MTTILVTSAAGAQGSATVHALRRAGHSVTGLIRQARPPIEDLECRRADLQRPDSLREVFEGIDTVVFTPPLDYRRDARESMADNLSRAAAAAGVRRIILNTAAPVFAEVSHPVSAVLRELRRILQSGSVPVFTVQPTIYMDNLLAPWAWSAIRDQGVLPYPAAPDTPISRISHRTLGESVVAAIASTADPGAVYDLGGPEAVSGRELADRIGERLGRPVQYQQIPLASFADSLNAVYSPPVGDDVAALYRLIEEQPARILRDGSGQRALGVDAETLDRFLDRALPPVPVG